MPTKYIKNLYTSFKNETMKKKPKYNRKDITKELDSISINTTNLEKYYMYSYIFYSYINEYK